MGTLVAFANELKDRIDIVDVINGYVKLRRTGSNWKGLCPFHREKTPSFMVSQPKQIFHCFGCHAGGDVFRFIELVEHIEWKDAVRLLAERYGVRMPEFRREGQQPDKDARRTLYEINELSCQLFSKILSKTLLVPNHPISIYLARRALDPDSIAKFRLGLASEDWTTLLDHLRHAGYHPDQAVAAGVVLRHPEKGSFYDRFRSRLIFPICDNLGRPVAFGARVYLPDAGTDQPKYINSPETDLYKKGQYLYGFHLAKETIARQGTAILVEGYFDVIRAHQHGFTNTVATCGTALTPDHVRTLRRLCDSVVFVYDGDEAGQKAMLRGCEVLLEHEFSINVVVLPDNHDPDSFLLEFGTEAFQRQLDAARDFYEFFLDTAIAQFGVHTVQGKVQAFNFLRPILSKVTNAIALQSYLARTAQILGTNEAALRRELTKSARAANPATSQTLPVPEFPAAPKQERYLLRLCIENEDLQFSILQLVPPEWLTHPMVKKWYALCRDRLLDGLSVSWSDLWELCPEPDSEDAQFLRALAVEEMEPMEFITSEALENVASRLERAAVVREVEKLKELCRALYPNEPDGGEWEKCITEIGARLQQLKKATCGCRPKPQIWRNNVVK
ncbi:MAG: DNA primase [Candidatus Sumerlaeaceae bacterium]